MKNQLFILNSQRLLDIKYFKISYIDTQKRIQSHTNEEYGLSNDAVPMQLLGNFHKVIHPGNTEFRG